MSSYLIKLKIIAVLYIYYVRNHHKKSKTNKYVFIEEKKIGNEAVIDDGLKLDFKGKQLDTMYYMSGDVDSSIMPEEVFNDGKSTYIKLSDNIEATELPVLHSFDEQGRLIQLNNPRYRKPFFVIDNLPTKYTFTLKRDDPTDPGNYYFPYLTYFSGDNYSDFKLWISKLTA